MILADWQRLITKDDDDPRFVALSLNVSQFI
jgi:hypothetical protein